MSSGISSPLSSVGWQLARAIAIARKAAIANISNLKISPTFKLCSSQFFLQEHSASKAGARSLGKYNDLVLTPPRNERNIRARAKKIPPTRARGIMDGVPLFG